MCTLTTHLYRVVLMVLDSFSTLQHPGEGELRAGRVLIFFFWSIPAPTWALFSSHTVLRLDLHPLLRVPLGVLGGLLFLLLLLLLLRVCVSFPLPVLSQLERRGRNQKVVLEVTNNIGRLLNDMLLNMLSHRLHSVYLTRTSRSDSKICLCKSVE